MPSINATVQVPVDVSAVYQYLRDRYNGQAYRSACMEARGYIPPVAHLEQVDYTKLRFFVPGRDALLRFPIGGWTWTYDLEDLGNSTTRIKVAYNWHWFLSILAFGTVRHQAANALTDDILAIEALAFGRS